MPLRRDGSKVVASDPIDNRRATIAGVPLSFQVVALTQNDTVAEPASKVTRIATGSRVMMLANVT
ncbi:hypothetical protein [Planctomycetes bacterium SV_7m_r]|uniref:hypothetical protein n=1 Tax=Stieleria bergensis TaxID=2528025 RepID=UPI0011A17535